MKLIYIAIWMMVFQSVYPQKVIDTAIFRASYTFSYKTDPTQKDFTRTDLMYLDVGEKLSKYYSHYTQIRDSNIAAGIKQGLSAYEVVEQSKQFKRGVNTVVYSLIKQGEFHVEEQLIDRYYYDEKRLTPQWTLKEGEKMHEGYLCKEAEAIYRGRKWTAYYAPEIPVQQGPWKLWGLPGLIIYAIDSDHLFEFELKGFETLSHEVPLSLASQDSMSSKYKKVSKKGYLEMERLRYKDYIAFVKIFALGRNGQVYFTPEQQRENEELRKRGGIPFIQIEK